MAFKRLTNGSYETEGDRHGTVKVLYAVTESKPTARSTPEEKEQFQVIINYLIAEAQKIASDSKVLINLLENAVFHSKSTRPIECQVIESVKEVSFHIIDYGVGICEEEIDTIFDGTVYNDNNSNSHKGMGIGLSICKTIILAHQGTIIAKNHKEGAEFIFSLPKESD